MAQQGVEQKHAMDRPRLETDFLLEVIECQNVVGFLDRTNSVRHDAALALREKLSHEVINQPFVRAGIQMFVPPYTLKAIQSSTQTATMKAARSSPAHAPRMRHAGFSTTESQTL